MHFLFVVSNIDSDPTAEISHFQIRIASVAAVLLHEDILTVSTEEDHILMPSSVQQMRNKATSFFESLGNFNFIGFTGKDFDNCKVAFEKACQLSHIR